MLDMFCKEVVVCLINLQLTMHSSSGIYQDWSNRVTDGACAPLLIHTDKSKTKEEKKKKEKDNEMVSKLLKRQQHHVSQ